LLQQQQEALSGQVVFVFPFLASPQATPADSTSAANNAIHLRISQPSRFNSRRLFAAVVLGIGASDTRRDTDPEQTLRNSAVRRAGRRRTVLHIDLLFSRSPAQALGQKPQGWRAARRLQRDGRANFPRSGDQISLSVSGSPEIFC
jgi:hypothetical protein